MSFSNITLDEALKSAYSLFWQPGMTLHPSWWTYWGMNDLMAIYPHLSLSGQRHIDGQIHAYRNLPVWRPALLSCEQLHLVHLQPRLFLLLTALGLLAMKCSGYLWLGRYRRMLNEIFSEQQLSQIAVLMRDSSQQVACQPEALLSTSLNAGWQAINQVMDRDPLWQALSFTLPHQTEFRSGDTLDDPLAALLRLERFL